MALLFAVTLFAAAALLFLVEPMIGKMLLPYFGGAPAVWNTCLAFFQAILLAAYAYAHALTRWRSTLGQVIVHLIVIGLACLLLPFAVSTGWAPRGGANPTVQLVGVLCATAMIPFFAVATTSPLLQQWFAGMRHRRAADPYFLYAASNAGSLVGLIAYPAFVEPAFALDKQSRLWSYGYGLLVVAVVACMVAAWRRASGARSSDSDHPAVRDSALPNRVARLHWVVLAFVPSSLLLGVTTYLSSDVSPVPLIWVVPLALYLLSFMIAFSWLPIWLYHAFACALPLLVAAQIYHTFTEHAGENYSIVRLASIHLVTFFCASMVCHGRLAQVRPASGFLTDYYFWISLGGVLGGLFNALVAPRLFNSLIEYPLVTSLACMLSPLVAWRWPRRRNWLDLPLATLIVGLAVTLLFYTYKEQRGESILICLGLCSLALGRPISFGLCAAALFAATGYYCDNVLDHIVLRHRDFYGVLSVRSDEANRFYFLHHGRILHGQQRRSDDPAVRNVPVSYYGATSPIGQLFAAPLPALESNPPVAVVGLGVGSLASYGQPGQEFTFYEVDPAVEQLARDERYFTYLRDSRANCRVVLGDARLSLADAPDGYFGLIVLDAFSGDAIPTHLLTVEAVQLYLRKLSPGGVLAFHISNQFLNLGPVLGNLAAATSLAAWEQTEDNLSKDEKAAGKTSSQWVILATREDDFGPLIEDTRWNMLLPVAELPLWTDHYTSLWGIAQWRRE